MNVEAELNEDREVERGPGGRGQTPLMRQYYRIKDRHPGALLLFRMGDFYETFDDDAVKVSKILGITLTKRANGKAADVPLAGFPHHALDSYLPRLVRAGERVAICEQLEEPSKTKKIVRRDVVEVVTPGISFRDQLLDPKKSNYLAAIYAAGPADDDTVGFAYLDASTGEFGVAETARDDFEELLQTFQPAEVLVPAHQNGGPNQLRLGDAVITKLDDWIFSFDYAYETLVQHFGTHSLKGFGIEGMDASVIAAGAALHYLSETQKGSVPYVRRIVPHATGEHMLLDPQTRRNLELVASMQDDSGDGSLFSILDRTVTPMGSRRLRRWLVRPLVRLEAIERRLTAVARFVDDNGLRKDLRKALAAVGDLERLGARVSTGRAGPRELVQVKRALRETPKVRQLLVGQADDLTNHLASLLDPCEALVDQIEAHLVDDPPGTPAAGGLIRAGISDELDELRDMAASSREWLTQMQKREAKQTGITSLKVGYNKVFGYYLEVTNAHKDKVPEHFIRKQTLVNAERYITPELKEFEERILTADERILVLEAELFAALRDLAATYTDNLQQNADSLAQLDCFAALAEAAKDLDYVRPVVDESRWLEIRDGRHPVVERLLPLGEPFIPNSLSMNPEEEQIIVITGPNMAGKSVALRQVGLIVLLAQVGSFVPAAHARIGLVDRIFTRVGASDNLAAGESTFLVEMNEAANILNNATQRSLILLDEVGRGTSTFDGLSIAWALAEYLHENERVAARTLFATHYHELNDLATELARVRNYRVQVQEHEGRVIFLRKLVPGGADHSYGIEVARMAGLPREVIARARTILQQLEGQHVQAHLQGKSTAHSVAPAREQMTLFAEDPVLSEIRNTLRDLDVNQITPVEALMKLSELKRRAES